MASGISKRYRRYSSEDVCAWTARFSSALPDASPYTPRDALAGKDARTLARGILVMTQEEISPAFRNSPMKRAKLRG